MYTGTGSFGRVWLGLLQSGELMAVKSIAIDPKGNPHNPNDPNKPNNPNLTRSGGQETVRPDQTGNQSYAKIKF